MTTVEHLRALLAANANPDPEHPDPDSIWIDLAGAAINALPALLGEALKDAIDQLQAHPNGYHHCRWCSGVDRHDATCAWVARNERIATIHEIARAALDRLEGTP